MCRDIKFDWLTILITNIFNNYYGKEAFKCYSKCNKDVDVAVKL